MRRRCQYVRHIGEDKCDAGTPTNSSDTVLAHTLADASQLERHLLIPRTSVLVSRILKERTSPHHQSPQHSSHNFLRRQGTPWAPAPFHLLVHSHSVSSSRASHSLPSYRSRIGHSYTTRAPDNSGYNAVLDMYTRDDDLGQGTPLTGQKEHVRTCWGFMDKLWGSPASFIIASCGPLIGFEVPAQR